MNCEYKNSNSTFDGINSITKLKDCIKPDSRVLLITTNSMIKHQYLDTIMSEIPSDDIKVIGNITPNPDLTNLERLICKLAKTGDSFDHIIGLGGGSVIDTSKVLSLCLPLKQKKPLTKIFKKREKMTWIDAIDLIAIPTSAGTGSEATQFATIWDKKEKKKYSLSSPFMLPRMAILDPSFTVSLPYDETRNTALDSISHSLESLWNKNKTEISERYAYEALELSSKNLGIVLKDPKNLAARHGLLLSSNLAGKAIAQTKTAIAHSISYPITAQLGIPHGLACSFTLASLLDRYMKKVENGSEQIRILIDTKNLLTSLNLPKAIRNYCNVSEILKLKGEMFTPDRAKNYLFNFTDKDLVSVINSSLYE